MSEACQTAQRERGKKGSCIPFNSSMMNFSKIFCVYYSTIHRSFKNCGLSVVFSFLKLAIDGHTSINDHNVARTYEIFKSLELWGACSTAFLKSFNWYLWIWCWDSLFMIWELKCLPNGPVYQKPLRSHTIT